MVFSKLPLPILMSFISASDHIEEASLHGLALLNDCLVWAGVEAAKWCDAPKH